MADDRERPCNLGESLKVENVVDLAAAGSNNLTDEILRKYIRQDVSLLRSDAGDDYDIPVINLEKLLHPKFSQEEACKLKFACEEWGFFQLVDHGISDEVIQKVNTDLQEFFQLPREEKEAFAQEQGDIQGYGQEFVVAEERPLDWVDMLFLVAQPVCYRKMKVWPTNPPTFRESLEKYSSEVQRVAQCLLEWMGKNLELEPAGKLDFLSELQSLRINYYPPCSHADKVLGLSPHSDSVALTLLLQFNQVQGLQIRKNGGWVPVQPLPGAFIVNIGDVLEILSNGKYKSIEHRAVVNPEKERLTVAAFHNQKPGGLIGPLPELVKGGRENYKSLTSADFSKFSQPSILDGKTVTDRLKI